MKSPRKTVSMKKNPKQLSLLNISNQLKQMEAKIDKVLKDELIESAWPTFVVTNRDLRIYTTIIARNIHHACNKATKDLQGRFHSLYEQREGSENNPIGHYRYPFIFKPVAEFNRLTRKGTN